MGFIALITACQQGDDRLKQKAAIEGEETARKQIEAERGYLRERALEMEADLSRRQRFYTAVSGTFEGTMKGETERETLNVRFVITASPPPLQSERARTIGEIESDLINQYFKIVVVQWAPGELGPGGVGFGCVFLNVKPDLNTGVINLASTDCSSLYILHIAEDGDLPDLKQTGLMQEISGRIAQNVLGIEGQTVLSIKGFRQPTRTEPMFRFSAVRSERR